MNKWNLLDILYQNASEYISGEKISESLNVTRSAIWKYMNELKSDGYEIESRSKVGYRLTVPEDVLNAYELDSQLKALGLGDVDSVFFRTLHSTNTFAKAHEAEHKSSLIVAESQTAGRGRFDRFFHSGGGGIYMSAVFRSGTADNLQLATVIAALAVVRMISAEADISASIKWPNDILFERRKLCGILTEASVEAESRRLLYLVIGIGLNVNERESDFNGGIADIATSLKMITGRQFNRARLIALILAELHKLLQTDQESILAEYRRHIILDVPVTIKSYTENFTGTAVDIDASGRLIVETENGEHKTVQSGEIEFVRDTR